MNRLISIGELIIDFASLGKGSIKDTEGFKKNAGGAPANVCCQASKLGIDTMYLSQVGDDGFGEFLIESLRKEGIDTTYVRKTKEYDTSLAFVSFKEDGEREFSFYRKMAADLYFKKDDFKNVKFDKSDILEFGSVALKTKIARDTHDYLIEKAREAGSIIAFDPNVRLNLWENHDELRNVIKEYAKKSDIVKIGDDELVFAYNKLIESEAIGEMFKGGVRAVIVTRGSKGSTLYLRNGKRMDSLPYRANPIDTTGAGDSFFGGFLASLIESSVGADGLLSDNTDYGKHLDMASRCGAYTTEGIGAMASMGNREQLLRMVR